MDLVAAVKPHYFISVFLLLLLKHCSWQRQQPAEKWGWDVGRDGWGHRVVWGTGILGVLLTFWSYILIAADVVTKSRKMHKNFWQRLRHCKRRWCPPDAQADYVEWVDRGSGNGALVLCDGAMGRWSHCRLELCVVLPELVFQLNFMAF